jgi:hypothetical protein
MATALTPLGARVGRAALWAIGTMVDAALGLHLHSGLATTTQGVPPGFAGAQCWARDAQEFGKKAQGHASAIQRKERWRWMQGCLSGGARARRRAVARTRQKNNLEVRDEQPRLFEAILAKPVAGYSCVQLPR